MGSPNQRPKTWTTPGPGRKACPGCGCYVGNRSKRCPCGQTFEVRTRLKSFAERSLQREANAKERLLKTEGGDLRPQLSIPAGRCPVELTGTGAATVQFWVEDLQQLHPRERLMPSCLKYWARRFFSMGSPEYTIVSGHIDRLTGDP